MEQTSFILNTTTHRPYKLPQSQWLYYQEWKQVLFLHYPVNENIITSLLPREINCECYNGTAWLSIVIFNVKRMHLKYTPPFPPVSNFKEVNLRTYVTDGKTPGI